MSNLIKRVTMTREYDEKGRVIKEITLEETFSPADQRWTQPYPYNPTQVWCSGALEKMNTYNINR